jgi:hypothetical protein
MKYEINNELMKVKENLTGRYSDWKGQYFVVTGKNNLLHSSAKNIVDYRFLATQAIL